MSWDFDQQRPIYVQLVETISLRIVTGIYPPGSRIPSVRELAAEAVVNPNTMQRALAELENKGLLFSERTNGRFVTNDISRLQQEKRLLATDHIQRFFYDMQQLGFDQAEALALAEETKEMKTE